jgi:uncharacterized protein (DUF2235 family)
MDTAQGRNLVVCLDGTGNELRVSRNTNVLRLFDMLDYSSERQQISYYDPGVGTFSALGAWSPLGRTATRLAGLAFGTGLRQNLGEAYLFLVRNWQPGDRLYLFGFSRGAYAARALAGLLDAIGMLHPHEENLLPYAISAYARKWAPDEKEGGSGGKRQEDLRSRFRESFARRLGAGDPEPIRVRYLGLWDTVEASGHLRGDLGWPGIKDVPNAETARHAVSIDEHRWPYRVVPLTHPDPAAGPVVREQVWFPGVHSDVGGTFPDPEPPCRLSDVTLKWVVDGACDAGLLVDQACYDTECAMYQEHTCAPVNSNAWPWWPLSFATRPLGEELVHASASGRPAQGRRRPALTGRASYADPDWWRPYGRTDPPAPPPWPATSPSAGRRTPTVRR